MAFGSRTRSVTVPGEVAAVIGVVAWAVTGVSVGITTNCLNRAHPLGETKRGSTSLNMRRECDPFDGIAGSCRESWRPELLGLQGDEGGCRPHCTMLARRKKSRQSAFNQV